MGWLYQMAWVVMGMGAGGVIVWAAREIMRELRR